MTATPWQVWIGDLRASKRIAPEARVQAAELLDESIRITVERYREAFKLRPSVLRGDEIQAVLIPDAPALTILTYLRARLATRGEKIQQVYAGIGLGTITSLHASNPFESDGPAFHRARQALDSLKDRKRGRALTAWITAAQPFDEVAKVILPLLDGYSSRWSREQWEAIEHRLRGATMQSIGEELGVAGQAVNKRLKVARWNEVSRAIHFLESRHPGAVDREPTPVDDRPGMGRPTREGAIEAPHGRRRTTPGG